MVCEETLPRQQGRYLSKCLAVAATILFISSSCAAQGTVTGQSAIMSPQYLTKYPGLLTEFGHLFDKLQHNVRVPPVRSQSRLLPLLPESTTLYVAFPNYGDAMHQSLKIFREELQESSVLRDWWQHGDLATHSPGVDVSLEKFYELSQYLGDEIVVSGTTEGRDPSLLIVAEVRKPGLADFLAEMARELGDKSNTAVRVLHAQELATAEDRNPTKGLLVLVRPDFVVASFDLATLRSFNAYLEERRRSRQFVSTPFGQRVGQAYEHGAAVVAAADLQKILRQNPISTKQNRLGLERTGFEDMKYLVWEHKSVPGQPASQMELSFTGPRHGVASWLAKPALLGSLDFVSPRALMAGTVVLKDPAQIFEDVNDLSASLNHKAFASLAPMEQALNLSLKEDLLRQLGGEITLELDSPVQPNPTWKAILKVNDPDHLQQTFTKLMTTVSVTAEQSNEGGVTYHSFRIPSPKKAFEIDYAFVDGYLVIASTRETVAEAVRLHRTGDSLAKSKKYLASLPLGHSSEASALFYQDPIAMTALRLQQVSPEVATFLSQLTAKATPNIVRIYGEESTLRETTSSSGIDAGAVLLTAAIAIPNLLRARIAANEASAAGTVRTVAVSEIAYSATYPRRGFASDLATLGADPYKAAPVSADHANLLNPTLVNASCTVGNWCTKSGFQFHLTAVCKKQLCGEFVVVGTPVSSNEGARSFCSTSDGMVRFKIGPPLTSLVSVSECQAWSPVK